jgi:N utilization substance protein B
MQALYQWHMTGDPVNDIEAQFRADNDMTHVDDEYFHELFKSVVNNQQDIDQLLEPCLDRDSKELDPVSLALLRLAAFELNQRIDVPYKVVISEAVALAKKFGPEDSYRYINAVLDKLAASERVAEVERDAQEAGD